MRLLRVSVALVILVGIIFIFLRLSGLPTGSGSPRVRQFLQWANGDEAQRQALVTVQREACPGAPFILPSDGFIGLLYGDPSGPYSQAAPHQGIDIFSNTPPGATPVYAAYDGFITREDSWRSALIQRVPADPLQPDRQIWLC